MLPIHPDLMYRAQQCAGAADSLVHSRLAAAHARFPTLPGRLFEVPREMWKRVSRSWDDARASIEAMEMQPLPYMQLEKLIDAARQTSQAITDEKLALSRRVAASRGESPSKTPKSFGPAGADEFLPGFFWVVASAFPHRLATIHSSLQRLLPGPDAKGEVQYLLTHLESSVMFLSRLHLDDDPPVPRGLPALPGGAAAALRHESSQHSMLASPARPALRVAQEGDMDVEMTEKVGSASFSSRALAIDAPRTASAPVERGLGNGAGDELPPSSLSALGRSLSLSSHDDATIPGLTRFADADAEVDSSEVRLQFHADHLTVRALDSRSQSVRDDISEASAATGASGRTGPDAEDQAGTSLAGD